MCGESRKHGLEGGKTPRGVYLSLLKDKEKGDIKKKLVWTMLESLRVLLILDGFDELAHNGSRAIAIQEIRDLVSHLDSSAVLVRELV